MSFYYLTEVKNTSNLELIIELGFMFAD